jgi:hypothetical protein
MQNSSFPWAVFPEDLPAVLDNHAAKRRRSA